MGRETFYTSRVRIERLGPPRQVRRATIPVDPPVLFGFHDEIVEHYKLQSGSFEPHAATLDYAVAATGG